MPLDLSLTTFSSLHIILFCIFARSRSKRTIKLSSKSIFVIKIEIEHKMACLSFESKLTINYATEINIET